MHERHGKPGRRRCHVRGAAVLLLVWVATAAASPSALVSLGGTEFRAGDILTVGVTASNPDGGPPAELLVGVVLAEGVTALFFLPSGTVSEPLSVSDRTRFPAFRSLAPGTTFSLPVFLRFAFPPAGVAPGTYRVFAALVRQEALSDGRLDPGDVLALDIKPLLFSPFNTFLPFWRKPFQGEFPVTNLFDHNVPQEFVDANGVQVAWWGQETSFFDGHNGYDFDMPEGIAILAVAAGEVVFAGVQPPLFCPPLGATVGGQLAVVIRHTATNGEEIQSGYVHLSRVDVAVGQRVRAGDSIGLSGNSGCSRNPHLHLVALRRGPGGGLTHVDPYGWEAAAPDPWVGHPQGTASAWLWRVGEAPEIFKERRVAPNLFGSAAPATITALRIMGWHDALRPNNEFVEVTLDERFAAGGAVDLSGHRLSNNRGDVFTFPNGFTLRAGQPVRVFSGAGSNTGSELFWGQRSGVWDDRGDCARLLRPDGSTAYSLGFGAECS